MLEDMLTARSPLLGSENKENFHPNLLLDSN
jgi:hypothetical protein